MVTRAAGPGPRYTLRIVTVGDLTSLLEPSLCTQPGRLARTDPDDPDLAANSISRTGDIYYAGKDFKKAMENYDAILNGYPDSPLAVYAQTQIGNIFLTIQ